MLSIRPRTLPGSCAIALFAGALTLGLSSRSPLRYTSLQGHIHRSAHPSRSKNAGSVSHAADLPAAPSVSENYVGSLENAQHWAHFPVTVAICPDSSLTSQRKDAILAGFRQWVQATDSQVSFRLVSDPSKAEIVVRSTPNLDHSITNSAYDRHSLTLAHANIRIGLAEPEHPGQTVSLVDVKSLAAHEFGHALGIDGHSTDPQDLMYPVLDNNRDVTRRDLNTLRLAYEQS